MLRLTLAQMRRSLGRLTAAGVAIVIGTAFVAATLVAGAVMTRTSYDAIAAEYADADYVAVAHGLTGDDVRRLRAVPGVLAADPVTSTWFQVEHGGTRLYPEVVPMASHPRLQAQVVRQGTLPADAGAVTVPADMAERLGVGIGDTVTAVREVWQVGDTGEEGMVTHTEQLTVSGLTEDPAGAFLSSGGAIIAHPEDAARWWSQDYADDATYSAVVVATQTPGDASVRAGLEDAVPKAAIRTKDEQARAMTAEVTDEADALTVTVLGFAAIALVVAALVIANTFQVLVAQRVRTLALLRCVGADKRQLHRSVLLEATLLGLASSLTGLLLGVGLAQGALVVLRRSVDAPLPAAVSVTPAVVIAPLAVGIAVTVLAALAPARAATRVAPLAALRPTDAPVGRARQSLPRLIAAVTMTAAGVGLLLLGVAAGREAAGFGPLGIGVLGGAISFVGVLLGAVFWVPVVVSRAGALLARTGTSAKLAAANTIRNPRRTAATSTALLIGVTLVAMMSTGAASARVTLDAELADHFPVDVALLGGDRVEIPHAAATAAEVEGVAATVVLEESTVELGGPYGAWIAGAYVGSPDGLASVLRSPRFAEGLVDGTVVVATERAHAFGLVDGGTVQVRALDEAGSPTGGTVPLTVRLTDLPDGVLLTPATAADVGLSSGSTMAWLKLEDGADIAETVADVQATLDDTPVQIMGAALERAQFQTIVDTLLAIVVGLLAVAVLIALVGVANTLSLSVIERRRESATLRAIGLTRAQLRGTLAVEGMLIAGVGAALGSGLGLLYGWAGAATVLGMVGDVRLDVPWRDLGLVVVVALAAGLLASVLPGRSAVRTSPVEALAVE